MKLNKKNLVKFIKEEELKFDNLESIEETFYEIVNNEFNLFWDINIRSTRDRGDYWLEITYYSKKIKKTIVINEEFEDIFDDAEQFADALLKCNEEIIDFENKLKYLK